MGLFSKSTLFEKGGYIKMKVIALRGEPNSGKTTVLKMLMDRLLKDEKNFVNSRFRTDTIKKMLNPKDEKWFTTNEKINISNLTLTLKYKEKYVTITSMGDSKELIVGSLKNAEKRLNKEGITDSEPDIYICACHPRMNLEKMLNCKGVIYIEKIKTPKIKRKDSEVVDIIISELNKLL